MPDEPIPAVAPTTLPRVLGLFDATMMVVGSIIGSGIFLKVGNVDRALQQYGFIPILSVWVGVGIVTLCGSLALAELGAMYPQAGGPYLYLREAYGRLPAFLWGWTEFWVVRTGSVGALACATVIYFTELVPLPGWGQAMMAVGIVIGLSAINVFSTRWGATVQNIATVAKVVFLAGLILLPIIMAKIQPENLHPMWTAPPDGGAASLSFWKAIGIAMIAVLWPYDGWINLAPVAEEIREPQRNVPRALALGLGIVIVVYMGAILSYHLTLTTTHLAESATVAADVFQKLFGSTGAKIAALGVMCSTFGATNSNMITGPRIYFAIARDGLLPRWINQVHPTRQTPANSIILQAVWTTLLVIVFYAWKEKPKDAFDGLTDSVICAGLIFYSLTVSAVYVLRIRQPNLVRPYKTWGYPITPALLLMAYAGAFTSLLIEQWKETAGVLILIASGIVYFQFAVRRQARA
jgi:APA family basic amino acid/polyamine antiporter